MALHNIVRLNVVFKFGRDSISFTLKYDYLLKIWKNSTSCLNKKFESFLQKNYNNKLKTKMFHFEIED